MNVWGTASRITKTTDLKTIIKQEKLRRDSQNSQDSQNFQNYQKFQNSENSKISNFNELSSELNPEPKIQNHNSHSKSSSFLNFQSYKQVEYNPNDDYLEETYFNYDGDFATENKKIAKTGLNSNNKTGKFKKDCKLAKYQNREFLSEPVVETEFNKDRFQGIHDWWASCEISVGV